MAAIGFIGVPDTSASGANWDQVAVPLNCSKPKLISPFESILATFVFWLSHLMIFRRNSGFCVFSSQKSISACGKGWGLKVVPEAFSGGGGAIAGVIKAVSARAGVIKTVRGGRTETTLEHRTDR